MPKTDVQKAISAFSQLGISGLVLNDIVKTETKVKLAELVKLVWEDMVDAYDDAIPQWIRDEIDPVTTDEHIEFVIDELRKGDF